MWILYCVKELFVYLYQMFLSKIPIYGRFIAGTSIKHAVYAGNTLYG